MGTGQKTGTEAGEWRYSRVLFCLFVGFLSHSVLLVTLSTGGIQLVFGIVFCSLVLLRTGVAALRHERNRLWVFYSLFSLCQGLVFWLIHGIHMTAFQARKRPPGSRSPDTGN